MIVQGYYTYNTEIFLAAAVVLHENKWWVVAYKCKENTERHSEYSLIWNKYHPIGKPILIPHEEFELFTLLNKPCLSCVHCDHFRISYPNRAWEDVIKEFDLSAIGDICHCSIRKDILLDMCIHELFVDCKYFLDKAENFDTCNEIDSLRIQNMIKQEAANNIITPISVMTYAPSVEVIMHILKSVSPDSSCYLLSGRKNRWFEIFEEYLEAKGVDPLCIRISASDLKNKYHNIMADFEVIYIPERHLVFYCACGRQNYPSGYEVCGNESIADEIKTIEEQLAKEPNKLYKRSDPYEYEYIRMFRGPIWDESMFEVQCPEEESAGE